MISNTQTHSVEKKSAKDAWIRGRDVKKIHSITDITARHEVIDEVAWSVFVSSLRMVVVLSGKMTS